MGNINTSPWIFENGGSLDIADGGSNIVLNIVEGTLEWTPMHYENVKWKDRNVLQLPQQGAPIAGTMRCEVRCGELSGSGSLYAKLMTAATAGAVEIFSTVVIKRPTYRGSGTFETLTFTNCYLDTSQLPTFRAGQGSDHDRLTFALEFLSGPAIT